MARRYVPGPVVRVPSDYRVVYGKENRIPYGQWKKEHKHWEKEHRKEEKERRKEGKHGRGYDKD